MKTSEGQFLVLVDFMERHGDLLKPMDGAHGRQQAVERWTELVRLLNMDASGQPKTLEKWKKVWSDLKNNTKRKAAKINRAIRGTGGGPACKLVLSDLEQRVLSLVGPVAATGMADVAEVGIELPQTSGLVQPPTHQESPSLLQTQQEEIVMEARHSIHRRETDDDIFAADEASDDEGTQNDELFEGRSPETLNQVPAVQASILTKPRSYEVKPGANVRLECAVDRDGDTVVQWYKGNDLYFMNTMKTYYERDIRRYSIAADSKDLLIENVELNDAGVFKCELVQATPVKIEHTLTVLEPPSISRFTATNDGNLVEGADLQLTCDVKGIPPPTIVWSRDDNEGNRRLGESDGEFSSNTVLIKNVGRHHTGKYYCYAFNSVNGSQAELLINVAGKPRVHVRKTVINSAINVEAILECSAHYENSPHIRWYKDGRLLEDSSSDYIISTLGSNSNLTVTPTKDADFGTYTCEAENLIGAHNRSISLVQRPVVEALDVDNAKLTWTIHSHQPLQEVNAQLHQIDAQGDGEWKRYNIPLPESRTHKYNMNYDLNDKQLADGKYEVVIKVKNDHSWSDNTEPIIFEMNVIQPQSIQHASMFGGGASTIRLSSLALSTTIMYLLVRLL